MSRGRAWLSVVPVWLMLLGLAGAAEAVIADPQGGLPIVCPGLPITQAKKDLTGTKRSYVWEGHCQVPGPSLVSVKIQAEFDGTDQVAEEKVEFAGPGNSGKILTKREGCASDPFMAIGSCAGAGFFNVTGSATILESTQIPLMQGRVPQNQAYETVRLAPAAPPPGAGQVRITKPVDRQSFVSGDKLAIEVRFTPANFTHPPKGPVGIQWGHETSIGTCTFNVGYLGVGHYSMAQMLGKESFPSPGRYCLRATSKPETGPVSTWTDWSEPVRIVIGERVAAKSGSPGPGFGKSSAATEKAMPEGGGPVIARLPSQAVSDATRQLQGLEGRLLRLGSNADAAKLLGDIRAYRARLGKEPDLTALQTRLRELTARVEGLESSVKKIPSTSPKATAGPSTKPSMGSQ